MEHVELPSTLRRIEYNAFRECKNLKNIVLPERLEYVGKYCFEESALESIRLPRALKIVDEDAFRCCENLRSVEFSEGLEKIGLFAFY